MKKRKSTNTKEKIQETERSDAFITLLTSLPKDVAYLMAFDEEVLAHVRALFKKEQEVQTPESKRIEGLLTRHSDLMRMHRDEFGSLDKFSAYLRTGQIARKEPGLETMIENDFALFCHLVLPDIFLQVYVFRRTPLVRIEQPDLSLLQYSTDLYTSVDRSFLSATLLKECSSDLAKAKQTAAAFRLAAPDVLPPIAYCFMYDVRMHILWNQFAYLQSLQVEVYWLWGINPRDTSRDKEERLFYSESDEECAQRYEYLPSDDLPTLDDALRNMGVHTEEDPHQEHGPLLTIDLRKADVAIHWQKPRQCKISTTAQKSLDLLEDKLSEFTDRLETVRDLFENDQLAKPQYKSAQYRDNTLRERMEKTSNLFNLSNMFNSLVYSARSKASVDMDTLFTHAVSHTEIQYESITPAKWRELILQKLALRPILLRIDSDEEMFYQATPQKGGHRGKILKSGERCFACNEPDAVFYSYVTDQMYCSADCYHTK